MDQLGRRLTGAALVLPASVLLIVSYVEPTIWTVRRSFSRLDIFRRSAGGASQGGVTTENYAEIVDAGLFDDIVFALSLTVVPAVGLFLVGPLIAWTTARAGRPARLVVRGLLALPLAAWAPTAYAVSWRAEVDGVAGASTARAALWVTSFAALTALGATIFLATRRLRPALVAGTVVALALVAGALQSFTFPYLLNGRTPVTTMFDRAFRFFDFNGAAAIASLLLVALSGLGLVAVVLLVATGLRIRWERPAGGDQAAWAGPVALVLAGGAVVVGALAVSTWLGRLGADGPPGSGRILVNTLLPPLLSALVAVGVAALAAVGIGVLRPFGRHSEWLLLIFAPWLFVGTDILALRAAASGDTALRSGSFVDLMPPTWLAIPALVLLTLLVGGLTDRYRELRELSVPAGAAVRRGYLWPGLPAVALAVGVVWLGHVHDLFWPVVTSGGQVPTAQSALLSLIQDFQRLDAAIAVVSPPLLLVLTAATAIVAQVTYLDRVTVDAGTMSR